jgi:hypothetical protein
MLSDFRRRHPTAPDPGLPTQAPFRPRLPSAPGSRPPQTVTRTVRPRLPSTAPYCLSPQPPCRLILLRLPAKPLELGVSRLGRDPVNTQDLAPIRVPIWPGRALSTGIPLRSPPGGGCMRPARGRGARALGVRRGTRATPAPSPEVYSQQAAESMGKAGGPTPESELILIHPGCRCRGTGVSVVWS